MSDDTIWYGPHACDLCGETVVRADLHGGGQRFDVPELLLHIYRRGSESGNVEITYPMTWQPHVCRENAGPLRAAERTTP